MLVSILFTPSVEQVFEHVQQAAHKHHTYSFAEARQSVLSSVCLELVDLPDVKFTSAEVLEKIKRPIAQYLYSISPATSAALSSYLPLLTAFVFLFFCLVFLFTFCISFTLFHRKWRRFFAHPQNFFVSFLVVS